jgi:outer membrane protein OmpA-like peptidoglycan-associated protein
LIYAAGVAALAVLAVTGLPKVARRIDSHLQTEADKAIAARGLTGIEARIDGQSAELRYAPGAIDVIADNDTDSLQPRMDRAVALMHRLTGGLYDSGKSGRLWGPVTRITIDQGSIDALADKIQARQETRAVANLQARTCTDQVTAAVASRSLSFLSGRADLTTDSQKVLDDVYAAIHQCPGRLALAVDGYTDDVGDEAANQALSLARANSAADGLVKRGLDAALVGAKGHGEADPVASNATPMGQATNRRVTFTMRPAPEVTP